jgi:hypothetical protein
MWGFYWRSYVKQDRQCTYKHNIEECSCNHFCCEKAISIAYSECVSVASVIQHAKCMRRIILPSVACMEIPYFATLSHKRQHFRKKLLNMKCVLILSTNLPETILILRRIQRDIIIKIHRSSGRVPAILVICYLFEFSQQIFQKHSNIKFH